jgi:hypothetical protein
VSKAILLRWNLDGYLQYSFQHGGVPVSACWPVTCPHLYVLAVFPHLVCIPADGADFLLVMRLYRRSSGHTKRYTRGSEVGVTEKMLHELMKHMEEMEAGGDNVTGI